MSTEFKPPTLKLRVASDDDFTDSQAVDDAGETGPPPSPVMSQYETACTVLTLESALEKLVAANRRKEADIVSKLLLDLHHDDITARDAEQILARIDVSRQLPPNRRRKVFHLVAATVAITILVVGACFLTGMVPGSVGKPTKDVQQAYLPANLLSDANFPHNTSAWHTRAYLSGFQPLTPETALGDFVNGVACIDVSTPDDTMLLQHVRVKPNTRYKLTGWIKTQDVQITQAGGHTGACLSVWDAWDVSESLSGTNDWTQVECVFDSGASNVCELGPRLGHHGSVARGKAWFKDLKLTEF